MPVTSARINAPFGSLVLHGTSAGLLAIDLSLEPAITNDEPALFLLREAARQFRAYFQDGAFEFSLLPIPDGTSYQRRVWLALAEIPRGTTLSYGCLAGGLGSGARAIAAACRANPLPILIPCHRVVGRHNPGGYCGKTRGRWLEVKEWLLQHERRAR